VNLDKLAKQLRRDLAANPKKSAALGLMVAVALYCWGPLVWDWLHSDEGKKTDQSQLAHLILTDDPLEPADKAKSRSKARFRWEKVRPLLAQDPRMVSATFDEVWIDPFGKPAAAAEDNDESQSASSAVTTAKAAAAEVSPADMGLTLSSIAIGSRRRAATISGERYFVGDEITVNSNNGSLPPTKLRVASITPHGVELECNGKTISLRLERSRLANGDAIERAPPSRDP
jgi:hypothetical protein